MTNPSAPAEVVQAPDAAEVWRQAYVAVYGCEPTHPKEMYQAAYDVINAALNTRPVASTLDPETAFRAGFDAATKYDWDYRAEGHEHQLREAELKRWLESPGKTGSAGVGEGKP